MSALTQVGTGELNAAAGPSGRDVCPAVLAQFEALARTGYRRLYSFALKMSENHEDAEDAVQQGFLAAYEHLADLKSAEKLPSWIGSIVLNSVRMQYRTKNRFVFSLDEEIKPTTDARFLHFLCDTRPSAEDRYIALELQAQLNSLIASLPAKLRETFLLRRVHGLNTAETAVQLGITQRLVRVRLSRASARMKRSFLRQTHNSGMRRVGKFHSRELHLYPTFKTNRERQHVLSEQFVPDPARCSSEEQ